MLVSAGIANEKQQKNKKKKKQKKQKNNTHTQIQAEKYINKLMRVKTEPETFNQNPISAALKLNQQHRVH